MPNGRIKRRTVRSSDRVIRKRKRRKAKNTTLGKSRKKTISGRRRKRSAYLLYYILVPVIVLTVITVLSLTVLFKAKQIEVENNQIYSDEEIIRVSGITVGDNLFRIRKGKLETLIETQLPYIEKAKIKRRIPSTVSIEITEAQPAFVIKDVELLMILSKNFKALEPLTGDIPPEFVLIKGLETEKCTVGYQVKFKDSENEKALHGVIRAMIDNDFRIRAIEFTESGIIRLNYDERIIVDIGGPVKIDHKVKMAKAVIENELAVTDKGILYVSGENTTSFRLDTGNLDLDYLINEPHDEPGADAEQPDETPAQ
ncbi:MAG: FtsQ-type POTRA domain-containing protein [Clostridia bacterium]|nr:FtsQ-type POTRA domain-containing protein [Clostridia bacterium]